MIDQDEMFEFIKYFSGIKEKNVAKAEKMEAYQPKGLNKLKTFVKC